ncbi:Pimeloyl-[acyl-carrier protein] methyl ester esterase [Rhodobacteraceae bacterium THAF1]|uniref:alpha/beta fold hydrolase n=1 Tax=Palleronia sp. THAF1 TaxID=2587842 RepID=UPI000F3B59E0|nr:alpha/beta hydrolase [Palleronia sp. THAF1]QFU09627.1 Pimeloyl-[acyl-carrier protein] methyl ester esterase [Palleronia sp. THAF1]VDC17472.1 Pimeloyl-[acyl-carrier protein] methyl ester esterase [Rhodobacteraceae bacterium THAF1]
MPTEVRGRIDTHWDEVGEGERVLMLHCSLALGRALMPLAKALGQGRAILPDLPGHGRSGDADADADYLGRAIAQAETFLDGPTDLIGHSLGGVVALGVAVRNPALVRSLTLIEPVLFAAAEGTDAHARYVEDHAPIMADIGGGNAVAATRAFMQIWGTGAPWDAMPEEMRAEMVKRIDLVRRSGPGLSQDKCGLLADGALEAVDAPVLLVRGAQTHPVIPAILDALEMRLPNATRTRIDGAGHMAPLTHAAQVAQAIKAPRA